MAVEKLSAIRKMISKSHLTWIHSVNSLQRFEECRNAIQTTIAIVKVFKILNLSGFYAIEHIVDNCQYPASLIMVIWTIASHNE